ncbi:hypothetical protein [Sodalinema gerasimenkoae]|uniref:hypothetical protein n=1 Tax=Sodalinema gerasimenkoae TaxID=2862348 RepID=UPI003CCE3EE7
MPARRCYVHEVLEHPTRMAHIRENARKTVLENYAHSVLLPRHIELMKEVAQGNLPEPQPIATPSSY